MGEVLDEVIFNKFALIQRILKAIEIDDGGLGLVGQGYVPKIVTLCFVKSKLNLQAKINGAPSSYFFILSGFI